MPDRFEEGATTKNMQQIIQRLSFKISKQFLAI
jgi:hypothetical protein